MSKYLLSLLLISSSASSISSDASNIERIDKCINFIQSKIKYHILPRFKQYNKNHTFKYESFFKKDFFYLQDQDATIMAIVLLEFMEEYISKNHNEYIAYKEMYTAEELELYIKDVSEVSEIYTKIQLSLEEKYQMASIIEMQLSIWPRIHYLEYMRKNEELLVALEFFVDLCTFVDKKIQN